MGQQYDVDGVIYEQGADGRYHPVSSGSSLPETIPLPMTAQEQAAQGRAQAGLAVSQHAESRQTQNTNLDNLRQMAQAYNSDPTVKAYRVAIQQLAQALGTGSGPQADLALTYAFAKAMDPDSVVRESEQQMVTGSQPWLDTAVEQAKKQFHMDGAGNYTPEARKALREQIVNATIQRVKLYDQRRNYFSDLAKQNGLDANLVVGQHDAMPFVDMLKQHDPQYQSDIAGVRADRAPLADDPETQAQVEKMLRSGAPLADLNGYLAQRGDAPLSQADYGAARRSYQRGQPVNVTAKKYGDTNTGQIMSGVNEGLAATLGGPVDLITGGLNALTRAQRAAGLDPHSATPIIENPVLGSQWLKDNVYDGWAIHPRTADLNQQFARRVGESVGSAAVPAMGAGSLPKAGLAMLGGFGGGVGGATAQRVAPGNPLAEMGGEMLGGGLASMGGLRIGQHSAQRAIEAGIPTVDQLKQQAGELYRSAEARGITADPMQTQALADTMRDTLRRAGRVSPTGRISEVYPKAREAQQLVDDYSGQSMNPTQMQTVRGVVADGLTSQDANERRIAGQLTDAFDEWAHPLAPELPQARDVASRYLAAQQLEKARSLAEAQASQFTGSGIENALRTQYRGLDRAAIRGSQRFNADVTDAIERVSRGTTGSNAARALGRFAPRGPLSFGVGTGAPMAIGAYAGGAPGALSLGGTAFALGEGGRFAATRMTKRAADLAELTARNGGALPQAPLATPDLQRVLAATSAAEIAKYLGVGDYPQAAENDGGQQQPQGFAGRSGQPQAVKRRRGLLGSSR